MLVGSIFSVGISTKLAQLGLHHLVLLPKMCKTLYLLHDVQLQDMRIFSVPKLIVPKLRICSVPQLIVPGPYSLASPVKLLHHYYYKTHYLLSYAILQNPVSNHLINFKMQTKGNNSFNCCPPPRQARVCNATTRVHYFGAVCHR